jgi:3-isopropylmalate/(R)-2-methylmalate dehydratase small subunit
MRTLLRGKAWVFQGILDVDWEILSYEVSRQLQQKGLPRTYEELGKYCMVNLDADFPRKVQKGDFIVGSQNVGYGHDHDQACMAIKGAGVGAVLCESSNGNFVRNSIDHGLPVVEIKGISTAVQQGDQLEVELAQGVCRNRRTGRVLEFARLPDFLLEILDAGGVYPMLQDRLKKGELRVAQKGPLQPR